MLDPRTVSSAYVRTLLATVEVQGVSGERVLHGLGLDMAQVTQANGRIGVGMSRMLWDRSLALTGDPLLGLKVAQEMRPNTFRVLGLATMGCATLEQAIAVMLRYQRLVSESGTLSSQVQPGGHIALSHSTQTLRVRILPQQVEALLGGLYRQALWLAARNFLPLEVCFQHTIQGDAQAYCDCFGIMPKFGADANRIVFSAADLRAPLPQADADLCRMHCAMADRMLADLPQVGYTSSFAVQWLTNQTPAQLRIEYLASALGMSVRSLQRSLRAEGKSWTALVDYARRNALAALLQQGISLESAARRLGYHDASSVSRAARRWFGTTPGKWRTDAKSVAPEREL